MSDPSSPFLPWLGIFETLRVERGRALFVEEHWASLNRSAAALGLSVDVDFRARPHPGGTGRWRWIVAADGARDLFAGEEEAAPETFSLVLAAQRLGTENWDARHKTLSHLTHWQARQAARAAGADEALLLNERGEPASGAMANLFWVFGGHLHTPAVEAGCRDGVIRNWVLRQMPTEIGLHPLAVLENADEIFLTNSLIGIKPVTAFNGQSYPMGPVAADLATRYRAAIA